MTTFCGHFCNKRMKHKYYSLVNYKYILHGHERIVILKKNYNHISFELS